MFKKVYDLVKYQYNSETTTEKEIDDFIKKMQDKNYNLQDSYCSSIFIKELVFTKNL